MSLFVPPGNVPPAPLIPSDANFTDVIVSNNVEVQQNTSMNTSKTLLTMSLNPTVANTLTPTAAQLLAGLITTSGSASAVNLTLPDASDIVSTLQTDFVSVDVGNSFTFTFSNGNTSSGAATLVMGSGGTSYSTYVVPINSGATFKVVLTNVTSGSEAYTVYHA